MAGPRESHSLIQRRTAGRTGLFRLLLLLLLFAVMGQLKAEPSTVSEEALLKAAYIYNFAKFTRWDTASGGETLYLCTVGHDSLAKALQRLSGKWVGERRVTVQPFSPASSGTCHILYFGASQAASYRTQLRGITQQPILTVSELPGFASNGGMIELFEEQERVRFRINLKAVESAGLNISSRLLNLAEIVGVEAN